MSTVNRVVHRGLSGARGAVLFEVSERGAPGGRRASSQESLCDELVRRYIWLYINYSVVLAQYVCVCVCVTRDTKKDEL